MTWIRWGGGWVHLLPSLCQKLSELVKIWRSYNKNNFACFFWDTVYIIRKVVMFKCSNLFYCLLACFILEHIWVSIWDSISLSTIVIYWSVHFICGKKGHLARNCFRRVQTAGMIPNMSISGQNRQWRPRTNYRNNRKDNSSDERSRNYNDSREETQESSH